MSSLVGVQNFEKKAVAFGLSHLILILVLVASVIAGVYLYDSRRADQADSRAALAALKAEQADQKNSAVQQSTSTQIAILASQNAALQQQVSALASAIAVRDAALSRAVSTVPSQSPSSLAVEWGVSAGEPAPAIDPQGNFIATLPLAQKSTIALMTVPTLKADNADLTAQVAKDTTVIANDGQSLRLEKEAHLSDNASCVADKAALNASVQKVKADGRRSKFRWAAMGYVAGLLSKPLVLAIGL